MKRPPRTEQWLLGISTLALALTALVSETVVMQRKMRFFGGGKFNNGFALTTFPQYVGFNLESLLYDVFFYGSLLAVVTLFLLPKKYWNPLQRQAFMMPIAVTVVVIVVAAKWRVLTYFSSMFDLKMLVALTEGKLANMRWWVSPWEFVILLAPALVLIPAVWLLLRWTRDRGRTIEPWRPNRRFFVPACLAWSLLVANHFLTAPLVTLRFGLGLKTSYWCIDRLLCGLTDFDRDGYGPLTLPPDPDNWDAAVTPYAVDRPGDGIDQDGLFGDLEAVDPAAAREGIRPVRRTNGKNVILIVVETLRADAVEMSLDGRQVAPFLTALRRDHAFTAYGYSNYGVTSRAIQTLFFGSLHYADHSRSLVDEFKAHGYRIYGASAQDEAWGDTRGIVGLSRTDAYYDSTDHDWSKETLTAIEKFSSLDKLGRTLNAAEVNEHALGMIDGAPKKPFFMYINYQELHFPYYEKTMDLVFVKEGHPHTDTAFFRPGNRENMLRQYCNGLHDLDKNIRRLFEGLKARGVLENSVVVIMGDHPDSFYENGVFGHAWTVDEHQRRTPLFVVNGRGEYNTPIGQDEVAPIILNSVDADLRLPRARFTGSPSRRLLMIGGLLESPLYLAWISKRDLFTYNFSTGHAQTRLDGPWRRRDRLSTAESADLKSLVNRWESERVLRARDQERKF
ncbi:MAG: sulfatase-like hydrolase/transferase [Elusimicrobia bacterium]|nr:sulfatase-like hydrolase/transferase [Elusimicrobiota bacterium]